MDQWDGEELPVKLRLMLKSARQGTEPASPPQADAAARSRDALLAESAEHTLPAVARPLT